MSWYKAKANNAICTKTCTTWWTILQSDRKLTPHNCQLTMAVGKRSSQVVSGSWLAQDPLLGPYWWTHPNYVCLLQNTPTMCETFCIKCATYNDFWLNRVMSFSSKSSIHTFTVKLLWNGLIVSVVRLYMFKNSKNQILMLTHSI